jgi:flagellar biosynthesis protein FlhG
MPNVHNDQAAGLRRIMTGHQPKIVSVLSAIPQHQPSLITNLAASIGTQDCDVLVIHTAQTAKVDMSQYGIKALPTLSDVAHQKLELSQSVKDSKFGFLVAKLYASQPHATKNYDVANIALNKTVERLSNLFEVILIDTALDKDHQLPLTMLNQHDILIQLSCDAESIKEAYSLIKRIYSNIGRRSFGIVVSNATDAQAAKTFRNISQVARNHMQVELEFFGAIPSDDYLHRAAKLGRAIIDAFPMTSGAKAFKHLAQRLNYKHHHTAESELVSLT